MKNDPTGTIRTYLIGALDSEGRIVPLSKSDFGGGGEVSDSDEDSATVEKLQLILNRLFAVSNADVGVVSVNDIGIGNPGSSPATSDTGNFNLNQYIQRLLKDKLNLSLSQLYENFRNTLAPEPSVYIQNISSGLQEGFSLYASMLRKNNFTCQYRVEGIASEQDYVKVIMEFSNELFNTAQMWTNLDGNDQITTHTKNDDYGFVKENLGCKLIRFRVVEVAGNARIEKLNIATTR